jgi:transposase
MVGGSLMPWPEKQRKAIAAKMQREGKSAKEISEFFRRHGHGGTLKKRLKRPNR